MGTRTQWIGDLWERAVRQLEPFHSPQDRADAERAITCLQAELLYNLENWDSSVSDSQVAKELRQYGELAQNLRFLGIKLSSPSKLSLRARFTSGEAKHPWAILFGDQWYLLPLEGGVPLPLAKTLEAMTHHCLIGAERHERSAYNNPGLKKDTWTAECGSPDLNLFYDCALLLIGADRPLRRIHHLARSVKELVGGEDPGETWGRDHQSRTLKWVKEVKRYLHPFASGLFPPESEIGCPELGAYDWLAYCQDNIPGQVDGDPSDLNLGPVAISLTKKRGSKRKSSAGGKKDLSAPPTK